MLTTSRVYVSSACCRFPSTACDPCSAFLCMGVMHLLVPRSTVCRCSNYLTFFCMFPVSHCQDLVLFAVCLLSVFVPSPLCSALFPFSLSLWTLTLKTKWKYFYCPVLSLTDVRKRTAFWKVPKLRPFVLLVRAISRWVWSNGGMKLKRQNRNTARKTCCSVTFSATNITWTELKLNPSLRRERLANSRPSIGTAKVDVYLNQLYVKARFVRHREHSPCALWRPTG